MAPADTMGNEYYLLPTCLYTKS